MRELQANLWKINFYKFFSDFLLIAPIMVPFYAANNLTAMQLFVVQAIFSLMLLLFEVPSGFFSDVVGRKKTMTIGAVAVIAGFGVYAFSASFWWFIVAETLLAFGVSMKSGTDSALLYDTLKELKKEEHYVKYEGIAGSWERSGTALSSLLGGALATIALRLPFYVNILTGLAMLVVALLFTEPVRSKWQTKNPFLDIISIAKQCVLHKKILSIMILASCIFTTGVISIWGSFVYFSQFNMSFVYYGAFFALFQFVCALGLRGVHLLEKILGKKYVMITILLIPFGYLMMGLFKSPFIFLLALVNAFIWGMSTPIFLDILNRFITSDMRATALSVSGMMGRLSFVILAPLFGKLIDLYSAGAAFLFLAGYFVCAGLASAYFWLKKEISYKPSAGDASREACVT